MTVENWPGRGYYRGNKQAMMNDAMRLGAVAVATPAPQIERKPPPPFMAATVVAPVMDRSEAKVNGYTGNSCQDCGSTRMKIAGHCEVCDDCGASSGCS